jgi:hypothetical protein
MAICCFSSAFPPPFLRAHLQSVHRYFCHSGSIGALLRTYSRLLAEVFCTGIPNKTQPHCHEGNWSVASGRVVFNRWWAYEPSPRRKHCRPAQAAIGKMWLEGFAWTSECHRRVLTLREMNFSLVFSGPDRSRAGITVREFFSPQNAPAVQVTASRSSSKHA